MARYLFDPVGVRDIRARIHNYQVDFVVALGKSQVPAGLAGADQVEVALTDFFGGWRDGQAQLGISFDNVKTMLDAAAEHHDGFDAAMGERFTPTNAP